MYIFSHYYSIMQLFYLKHIPDIVFKNRVTPNRKETMKSETRNSKQLISTERPETNWEQKRRRQLKPKDPQLETN